MVLDLNLFDISRYSAKYSAIQISTVSNTMVFLLLQVLYYCYYQYVSFNVQLLFH